MVALEQPSGSEQYNCRSNQAKTPQPPKPAWSKSTPSGKVARLLAPKVKASSSKVSETWTKSFSPPWLQEPLKDIMGSLDVIMRRRRLVEPHDWQPIQDPNVIAGMMKAWRREWLR